MSTENGIPIMNKPVNAMEAGPNAGNLAAAALQRHPIEDQQQRHGECYCSILCAYFFRLSFC
jgi:hypothetical protein